MTTTEETTNAALDVEGECGCGSFCMDTPYLHELLIRFEEYDACFAAEVVVGLIGDGELGVGQDLEYNPPDTFKDFVARHNWRHPARMADLAALVQMAAEQARRGREAGAPSAR